MHERGIIIGQAAALLHLLVILPFLQLKRKEGAQDGDNENNEEDDDNDDADIERVVAAAGCDGEEGGRTVGHDGAQGRDVGEERAAALEGLDLVVDCEVDEATSES